VQERKRVGGLLIGLYSVSGSALADWTGKGEIGASLASGNSENEPAPSRMQSDGRSAVSPTTRSPSVPTGSARSATRTTGSVRSSSRRRSRPVWGTRSSTPNLEHQLTDTTKIVDRFLIESNSDNTYMQNDLGLEVTITGSLGLRLAYQVRHNTDVRPGVEKTDTLTTVGLIYETK